MPRSSADKFEDFTFWAIKFYCEDLIKSQGIATAQQLIDFALSNFENKSHSTLKAKCRSVWNYYEKNNWKIPGAYTRKFKNNDKGLKMTRQERALENARIKEERARNKVINTVTGLMAETYKKKNGAWHISKIAKDTGLHRETVSKHLNHYLAEYDQSVEDYKAMKRG